MKFNIKNLFKGKNTQIEQVPKERHIPTRQDFVDDSHPNDGISKVFNLDRLLTHCSQDFEALGYSDAELSPNTSYRDETVVTLLGSLDIMVDRTEQHYLDVISKTTHQIGIMNNIGNLDMESALRLNKDRYEEQLEKVYEVKKGGEMKNRIKVSYNRGFNRGLTIVANEMRFTLQRENNGEY